MDGENHGKTLLKWMIWEENPLFSETHNWSLNLRLEGWNPKTSASRIPLRMEPEGQEGALYKQVLSLFCGKSLHSKKQNTCILYIYIYTWILNQNLIVNIWMYICINRKCIYFITYVSFVSSFVSFLHLLRHFHKLTCWYSDLLQHLWRMFFVAKNRFLPMIL